MVWDHFYQAGIKVKIITGDNYETTKAIAQEINFIGYDDSISGEELMKLNEYDLRKCVLETNIFTRMFPDAKLKIINSLKFQNQIDAMTGDWVNDGPALKAAHIGIAIGKKGTEIPKQAASLILLEDDLSKMLDSIAIGRRIYTNLKKAIHYIISIHIPIVLTVIIPLALNWKYPNILSPIHIIFLELIMGPTCFIIFENEPIEKTTMLLPPRQLTNSLFNKMEIFTSIIQGLVITIGILLVYQYSIYKAFDEAYIRTMIFIVIITSNVFLTLVNRSNYYSILTTLFYKNNMIPFIISLSVFITGLLIYIPTLTTFFEFKSLEIEHLLISIVIGFISVIWFEFEKWLLDIKIKIIRFLIINKSCKF